MADKNDSRKEKRIVNFDRGDELSRELSAGRDQDIEKQAKSEVKDTGVPDFSMGDAYTSECENRFSNTSEKKISEATSLSMGKPQESAEQGDTAVTSVSAESPPDREVEMGINYCYGLPILIQERLPLMRKTSPKLPRQACANKSPMCRKSRCYFTAPSAKISLTADLTRPMLRLKKLPRRLALTTSSSNCKTVLTR